MSKHIECDSGEDFTLTIIGNSVIEIKRSEQCGFSVMWLTHAEAREIAAALTALLDEHLDGPLP